MPFDAASGGHMLAGARESGERYLAYCLESARWTSRDYAKVLTLDLETVFMRLLNEYPWPGELSRHDREFLAKQIKPYEVPVLSAAIRTSGGKGAESFSSMSVSKKVQRLERVEKVAIAVMGGMRPYRYRITHNDQVVREGVGDLEPLNPFSWQDFPMPWPVTSREGELRFEATDAAGATLVQRINVIGESALEAFPPSITTPDTGVSTGKNL